MSKLEKSIKCDHYLIGSQGGQDTSAWKMPFRQWVLQEMTRNPKFDAFHYDKIVPKLEQGKSEGFESCDRPIVRKRPIWVKVGDVLSRVTLKFYG